MDNSAESSHLKPPTHFSFILDLVYSRPTGMPKWVAFGLVSFTSAIFSLPRYPDTWVLWVIVTFPTAVLFMLILAEQISKIIERLHQMGLQLLADSKTREEYESWFHNLNRRNHFIWCAFCGGILAIIVSLFNANPYWTRYTDAFGILYLGFVVGDIVYLFWLIILWVSKLEQKPLRLNQFDPANTLDLRIFAETVLQGAFKVVFALLAVNILMGTTAFFFPHLFIGVIIISILSWSTVIILVGYPHLIFWRIVQETKLRTLRALESRLIQHYDDTILQEGTPSQRTGNIIELYRLTIESKSSPTSFGTVFGIIATALLNILPLALQILVK